MCRAVLCYNVFSISSLGAADIFDRVPGGFDLLEIHDEIGRLSFFIGPFYRIIKRNTFQVHRRFFPDHFLVGAIGFAIHNGIHIHVIGEEGNEFGYFPREDIHHAARKIGAVQYFGKGYGAKRLAVSGQHNAGISTGDDGSDQ